MAELGSRAIFGQPVSLGTQMAPGRTQGHCPSAAPTWGLIQAQRQGEDSVTIVWRLIVKCRVPA